jgi:diguanylate cyclase (GGDEF)-like protein
MFSGLRPDPGQRVIQNMVAIAFTKTATLLKRLREKLLFLRGNSGWVIAWPVAAIVFCAMGWYLLLANLDRQRQEAESDTLREAGALARSYAAHLSRTVETVDQILLHVKYEWELSNGQLRLENIQSKGLFPPTSVFNVSIIDRDGNLVTTSVPGAGTLNVEDQPYFAIHKTSHADELHIGKPVLSRLSKKRVILFSRRLEGNNGSFNGVALVSVIPAYLTANYDEVIFGDNGFLAVIGDDNIIRVTRIGGTVHSPESPALLSPPRRSPQGGSTLLNGSDWFADQRNRYVGWQPVTGYPLTAMVGLDQEAELSRYGANRATLIQEAIWATAILAILTIIAMSFSARLAWRKYQWDRSQFAYRVATEVGDEGFYIVRPVADTQGSVIDFVVSDSNRRGAELLRQRSEELIGMKISRLYEAANPDRLIGLLRQAMEAGYYEEDIEVPSESPLIPRWVHLTIVRAGDELAVTLRDITETKAHVHELEQRSNEDTLTGLPNRRWVQRYLPKAVKHAAQHQMLLAVLFIDLDGFKAVNDAAGHAAGDKLLRLAAKRLQDAVRPHDHVVRLGGDEFLVIIEQIEDKTDAEHLAARIRQAFKESFRLAQGAYYVGTSIGISSFPSDGEDAETLLQNADIAMYSVKASGKGDFRFYDQKFYDELRVRLQKKEELRQAIEHDQFVMYYQPRVDTVTGVTSSMEALVRWNHPSKGLLSPLEFITLAEETGLILGLGELIINKVCAQLELWSRRAEQLVPVSINVSPRQFNEVDVPHILATALERYGTPPSLVEIEVTESSMIADNAKISEALTAIRQMGIKLLVDDFGTGYSSLSQLQRLDFDVLKVDRAFTIEIGRTEKADVFYKAIITMAHALGMRVVAEGVETETQARTLRSLKCDEIQGFYISKPLPPSDRQPILDRWRFSTSL